MTRLSALRAGILAAVAASALAGCSLSSSAAVTDQGPADTLRLGYFANVTHAPALIGLDEGLFADALGDTTLETHVFSAGPAAIEALSAGAIDAAYIGPAPAINTYLKSRGASARIVAGVSVGGASLVVRDGIDSAADLKGATLATPQLGNTQDVALRSWLRAQGLESNITGGGDVAITPTDNSEALTLFQAGRIDGAWVPEPWASRLVIDGGGHVLVDEAELWPDGEFATTVLLVNADFLTAHPETVSALLSGHVAAVQWLNDNPEDAAADINTRIAAETGKPLAREVIDRALRSVRFTVDPAASTFPTLVANAVAAGIGVTGDLDGIFELTLLNTVLRTADLPAVSAAGLGKE